MSLTLEDNNSNYQIKGYRPGEIKINDRIYTESVIITPNQMLSPWTPQSLTALTAEDLNIILTLKPTILLIGTGEKLIFPHISVYGHLINHGIGVEIMDTRAACRTYHALSAEGRNVVAALIIK